MRGTKRKYAPAHILLVETCILFNLKAEERSLSRYVRVISRLWAAIIIGARIRNYVLCEIT